MAIKKVTASTLAVSESADALLKSTINSKLSPRALRGVSSGYLRDEVQPLLDQAGPQHVTHNVLRRIERRGLRVPKGISFRAKMLEMSEARKLGVLRPTWALDQKNSAYAFLDGLGVRRPQSDTQTYSFDALPRETPGVIKATKSTGARGCYLLFSESRIVHVRDNETFSSWEDFENHARALMARDDTTNPNPLPDRWMVEELVLEDASAGTAARNLKFYAFYGEILLMQESRREPDLEVAFWTADNQPTRTGRYEDLVFDGIGVTSEHLETVSAISRAIPHPFMRIDMLNGQDGIVFGEFTPRPGNFDEFNDHWDRVLGEAWVRAESRILADLLHGRTFGPYLESTRLLEK
ncbi:ATP-grasp fold amidoligase family protein [Nesterenkonia sp. HG001]|uniref:ATP-grasp fold amidoligase family protein n=1 Tax=Nesterenkonia sp. HG001 TaxID=2983207 RepID=UPI002AC4C3AD|nr:ATP-grasp fold amidoligase family protein [Nesterenkonia sp. HG001]MDZ5077003.1 hypothetical protein [Nesterenkonia sp. HG001]